MKTDYLMNSCINCIFHFDEAIKLCVVVKNEFYSFRTKGPKWLYFVLDNTLASKSQKTYFSGSKFINADSSYNVYCTQLSNALKKLNFH